MNDTPFVLPFRGPEHTPRMVASIARLLRRVLEVRYDNAAGPWIALTRFADEDRCIAALEVAVLPLILEGASTKTGAIRSVAVDPEWRGRGLFRALMEEALAWIEMQRIPITMLYTAEPGLYERFGFRGVAQHAFSGCAPVPGRRIPSRLLNLEFADDRNLVVRMVEGRTPLSLQAFLDIDTGSILSKLGDDDSMAVVYVEALDAIVVFEEDERELVLADIIAARIPSLAQILGVMGRPFDRVTTLFVPDRLGWDGTPVAQDTGLMVRGTPTDWFERPFTLPPTAEF